MASYITSEFYTENYLLGRKPALPLTEFDYWEKQARSFVDLFTFDRIKNNREHIEQFTDEIGSALCALAEHLYMNEGSYNKTSESISGRSVSYIQDIEYQICQRYLLETGLMFRGMR